MRLREILLGFLLGVLLDPQLPDAGARRHKRVRLARLDDAIPPGTLDLFVCRKLDRSDVFASRPDKAADELRQCRSCVQSVGPIFKVPRHDPAAMALPLRPQLPKRAGSFWLVCWSSRTSAGIRPVSVAASSKKLSHAAVPLSSFRALA